MRKRILTEDDLKRNLSEFTQDSTHRTVTDKEKTDWNKKLDNIVNVDSSKSKTKGNASAGKWTGVGTVRNLEDWVGDFNTRSVENRDNIKANKNSIKINKNNINDLSIRSMRMNERLDGFEDKIPSEATIKQWAADVAYTEDIFANGYPISVKLNEVFGTYFSYNIRDLDDLCSSSTAMSEFVSDPNLVEAGLRSLAFINKALRNSVSVRSLVDNPTAWAIILTKREIVGRAQKYDAFWNYVGRDSIKYKALTDAINNSY